MLQGTEDGAADAGMEKSVTVGSGFGEKDADASTSLYQVTYDAGLQAAQLKWNVQKMTGLKIRFEYLDYVQTVLVSDGSIVLEHIPFETGQGTFSVVCKQLRDDDSICASEVITGTTSEYFVGQVMYLWTGRTGNVYYSAFESSVPAGVIYEVREEGSAYKMIALYDAYQSETGVGWCARRAVIGDLYDSIFSVPSEYEDDGYATFQAMNRYFQKVGVQYLYAFYNCKYYDPRKPFGYAYNNGGWYLPARMEMYKVYTVLAEVEAAMVAVGGSPLSREGNYWTATPGSIMRQAWYIYFTDGTLTTETKDRDGKDSYIKDLKHIRSVYNSRR